MTSTIKPMLAGKWPGIDKIKFPVCVQPKLDGIRCLVKDGVALSRTFKPIPSAYIQAQIGRPEYEGFDGELIVGDPTDDDCYRKTVSGVMAEDKTPDFVFHVFDCWDMPGVPYLQRRDYLLSHCPRSPFNALVPYVTAENGAELDAAESAYVEQGYEGAILRGPQTNYKYGRGNATNGDLLKMKRFTDFEALVVGVVEEEHNGNEATLDAFGRTERSSVKANKTGKGTLGALVCIRSADVDLPAAALPFKVGTGFSATERMDLWAKRADLVGKTIKVKSFPVGEFERPRHPVYLGMRDLIDIGDPA